MLYLYSIYAVFLFNTRTGAEDVSHSGSLIARLSRSTRELATQRRRRRRRVRLMNRFLRF